MLRKVRKTLNQVEKVLMGNDQAAADLWNILSALRGPDAGYGKAQATIPVRRKAFPKLTRLDEKEGSNIPAALSSFKANPGRFELETLPASHFRTHAEWAKEAFERRDRSRK